MRNTSLEQKKKLLILVDWFAPGYKAGGPIQSCVNVSLALKQDYEVFVFTSDRDFGSEQPYEGVLRDQWTTQFDPSIRVFYASPAALSRKRICEVLQAVQADYIYLNHLFSPRFVVYPLWLLRRKKLSAKFVVCPRGALYESALSVKRYKKTPFLVLFKALGIPRLLRFHATNEREKQAILDHFPGCEVLIADNLPNSRQLPLLLPEKKTGSLKCIFIARIHPIKNLLFLLQALQRVKAQVIVTVVGPMEDEAYWEKCRQTILQLPASVSVQYEGAIPNHQLPALLQQQHLFALPTTGENFGHSIFEALLAGRPVLISDQTPWLELEKAGIGWDIPLNNLPAFTAALESAAGWNQADFEKHATAAWNFAKSFISNPALRQQYLHLFS